MDTHRRYFEHWPAFLNRSSPDFPRDSARTAVLIHKEKQWAPRCINVEEKAYLSIEISMIRFHYTWYAFYSLLFPWNIWIPWWDNFILLPLFIRANTLMPNNGLEILSDVNQGVSLPHVDTHIRHRFSFNYILYSAVFLRREHWHGD